MSTITEIQNQVKWHRRFLFENDDSRFLCAPNGKVESIPPRVLLSNRENFRAMLSIPLAEVKYYTQDDYERNIREEYCDTKYGDIYFWKYKFFEKLPSTSSGQISADTTLRYPDLIAKIDTVFPAPSEVFESVASDIVNQINKATYHEEIFNILDLAGCKKIAKRLRYLHEITQDDDPEDPAMQLISLREFAQFFTSDGLALPKPEIGIDPDGLLQAEWYSNKGSALMAFSPNGIVHFAATLASDNQNEVQNIQGTGPKSFAMWVTKSFIV